MDNYDYYVGVIGHRGAIVVDWTLKYQTYDQASEACDVAKTIERAWYVVVVGAYATR